MGEELSFCELRRKEIVNITDGRRLGRIIDLIFSPESGCVLGIVAPFTRKLFRAQEVYIPFINIKKIGPDVILVKLNDELSRSEGCIDMERFVKRGKGCYNRDCDKDKKEDHGRDKDDKHYGHHHDPHNARYNYDRDKHNCRDFDKDKHHHNNCECDKCDKKEPHCDKNCDKCMLFDCGCRWCDFLGRRL